MLENVTKTKKKPWVSVLKLAELFIERIKIGATDLLVASANHACRVPVLFLNTTSVLLFLK